MQLKNIYPWLIWLTAGFFYLFEFIHRIVISVMIPELSAAFHVSIATLGELSAYYFFAYAIAQIPVGMLIDRYGTRLILSISCLIIACSSLLFAFTDSIGIASICRLLIGLGSASAFVGCLKIGASWFPANRFGLIVGLTNLLGVSGAIIGGHPIARAVEVFDWRTIMQGSFIIGIILTIILWIIVRDKYINNTHQSPLMPRLTAAIKNRQNWIVSAFASLMVAPIVAYSELWGVSFLTSEYSLARPIAAQITTITFMGIAFGGPVIGFLSDHFRQRKLPMLYGAIGSFSCIGVILFIPDLPLALLYMLHIAFGFFSSSMLLCFSLISETAQQNFRATAVGLTNSVIMLGGALLQTISGIILNASAVNYNLGFAPIIVCYILALLCYCFIRETRCHYNDN